MVGQSMWGELRLKVQSEHYTVLLGRTNKFLMETVFLGPSQLSGIGRRKNRPSGLLLGSFLTDKRHGNFRSIRIGHYTGGVGALI